MTWIQPITLSGRTRAACTPTRVFLADELDRRPASNPERRFVLFMALYAGDVLRGNLPGPYHDEDASRFARACLIPAEVLERPLHDVQQTARGLRVPARELAAAYEERRSPQPDQCRFKDDK